MGCLQEFARLTELVHTLEKQKEHMLQDGELVRELEFERKLNELLDEYGVPRERLLEILLGRPDAPRAIRKELADVGSLKSETLAPTPAKQAAASTAPEPGLRPASSNAAAWREKFGHRSFESWFNQAKPERS
ncbi:hypothetical protein PS631_02105 [Pseudomonas fluorescens]|uniref:Uncharacterized protein n=1 Tax=Pseudomonas fluorescens TaxID=294 RepID=A0A5E6SH74_PSEFL|nr:hypothetical protein [Pseudomonas fluorescens]VVM76675.1 hypothetical protein PS631_02105 [Pseudomonas fluorescens]